MMDLALQEIKGSGDIDQERVIAKVNVDTNVGNYLLFASKAQSDGVYGGEGRGFWLQDIKAKKGDLVIIYSKTGDYKKKDNADGTTSHFIYLGSTKTIWNDDERAAVLFHVANNFSKCRVGGFDNETDVEPTAAPSTAANTEESSS